jgi:hypothetical protein
MERGSLVRQVLPYAVMLAVSGWLYWAASRIEQGTGGRIGPDVWPKAVIVIMALLCVYEIGKRLWLGSSQSAHGIIGGLTASPTETAVAQATAPLPGTHGAKLAGGILLVAAYVGAVPWLGFFVTTALFLAVFPWVGGLRRPVLAGTLGVAGSLVLVVVFMRVAYISLPLGEGPFRSLSLALLRVVGVS